MEILVYSGLELLGDGVMKLPFVWALRREFPGARITWLAGKGRTVYAGALAPLVRNAVDEVIEDAGIGSRAAELLRNPLPGRRFDLVIDTQRRVLTSLILRRIRTRRFVSGAAGFWLSSRRPAPGYRKPEAMLRQMLDLLELAAGRKVAPAFDLALEPRWEEEAAALLPAGPRWLGIAPGAGGVHKRWPLERFLSLAAALPERGLAPAFLLGPDEAAMQGEIAAALPEARFPLQEADGAAPSPLLTMALCRRLAAVVANDSGTGHLAAAAGAPMVSLFGPTRAAKFAPAARRLELVEAQRFGGDAMDAIPVAAVLTALDRVLQSTPGSGSGAAPSPSASEASSR